MQTNMPQSIRWIFATFTLLIISGAFLIVKYVPAEVQTVDHLTCPDLDIRKYGEILAIGGGYYKFRTYNGKISYAPIAECLLDENLPLTDPEYKAYLETGKP